MCGLPGSSYSSLPTGDADTHLRFSLNISQTDDLMENRLSPLLKRGRPMISPQINDMPAADIYERGR